MTDLYDNPGVAIGRVNLFGPSSTVLKKKHYGPLCGVHGKPMVASGKNYNCEAYGCIEYVRAVEPCPACGAVVAEGVPHGHDR